MPVGAQRVVRRQRGLHAAAGGENRGVVAVAQRDDLADAERRVVAVDRAEKAEADVDRARRSSAAARTARQALVRIGRRQDRHAGNRAQQRDVLDGVMRRAPRPRFEAGERGDELHVVAVVGAVVADLLEAAHADERRHAEHERQLAGMREAGGDADEVLLADADVEVALGKAVGEAAQRAEVLRHEDDARIGFRELADRLHGADRAVK